MMPGFVREQTEGGKGGKTKEGKTERGTAGKRENV
jgi:hypothetical protein